MVGTATSPRESQRLAAWFDAVKQAPPQSKFFAIGLLSLIPALLTSGPILAAMAIWYRGSRSLEASATLFFATLILMAMFAVSALSLGAAWRRSRTTPMPADVQG
ncbi:hypothetical protein ACFV4K_33720 [Nocardia sp. NPDC059764]|uniref:hypothetical protein n=1 Tax=Nocardia sp. NPDC059764 TaxID=3346939 RepID=UPI00364AED6E